MRTFLKFLLYPVFAIIKLTTLLLTLIVVILLFIFDIWYIGLAGKSPSYSTAFGVGMDAFKKYIGINK